MVLTAVKENLPQLTTLQRGEVSRSFRQGIEDAVSLMDDAMLPAEYHSAILALTNTSSRHWARNQPPVSSRTRAALPGLLVSLAPAAEMKIGADGRPSRSQPGPSRPSCRSTTHPLPSI